MPTPFQAATWAKRADIPSPTLFGEISGAVQGVVSASFHPASKVVQTIGPVAHSFTTIFGAAQASTDEGRTWVDTYRGDLVADETAREWVVATWSLDLPNGLTYHYQARAQLTHSFFVADGSLLPGGIRLYASDNGTSFSMLQQLYSWPHVIADPANTGGYSVLTTAPSVTPPIFLPGTGPDGGDAFWMAVSYQIDCGGTNNRQTLRAQDIWRSDDGFVWTKVRSLIGVAPFSAVVPNPAFSYWFESRGRLFLAYSSGLAYTDAGTPDSASWAGSVNLQTPLGPYIVPMFGGTLLTNRQGTLISNGFGQISCDNGANFQAAPGGSLIIPTNRPALMAKIGPSEAICITSGFIDPATQTVCYYSSDGGETFQGGEVWLASTIGESPVALFIKSDGRPLAITQQRAFVSSDTARGIATVRVICPLANAGLAAARPLVLCGAPLTPICKD